MSKTVHLCSLKEALPHIHSEDRCSATQSGVSISYRKSKPKRKQRTKLLMGNAQNPPDTKRKLVKKIPPRKKRYWPYCKDRYEDDVSGEVNGGKRQSLCTAGKMGTVYDSTSAVQMKISEKKSMDTM